MYNKMTLLLFFLLNIIIQTDKIKNPITTIMLMNNNIIMYDIKIR